VHYQDIRSEVRYQDSQRLRDEWLQWLTEVRRLQPRTIRTYAWITQAWIDWCARLESAPLDPTLGELEKFCTRQPAASSQRLSSATMRSWFEWLHKRGYVTADPTLDLSRVTIRRRRPKPIPDEHWKAIASGPMHLLLRTAVGLGYYCGLRRAEVCGVQVDGVSLEESKLAIVGKGGDEQEIDYGLMVDVLRHTRPDLAEHSEAWLDGLAHYAKHHRGLLIGWRDPHTFYKLFQRHCRKMNLPGYTPHQLRHSCATNLANSGLPMHLVQRLMRHQTLDTTLNYVAGGTNDVRNWLLTKQGD
jgi:integrase